jgi:hypothetical protein
MGKGSSSGKNGMILSMDKPTYTDGPITKKAQKKS